MWRQWWCFVFGQVLNISASAVSYKCVKGFLDVYEDPARIQAIAMTHANKAEQLIRHFKQWNNNNDIVVFQAPSMIQLFFFALFAEVFVLNDFILRYGTSWTLQKRLFRPLQVRNFLKVLAAIYIFFLQPHCTPLEWHAKYDNDIVKIYEGEFQNDPAVQHLQNFYMENPMKVTAFVMWSIHFYISVHGLEHAVGEWMNLIKQCCCCRRSRARKHTMHYYD